MLILPGRVTAPGRYLTGATTHPIPMRFRLSFLPALLLVALLVGGADGCSSDPNVEGAKLNYRSGEYDDALSNLDAALESNPDNVEALALKAEVLREKMDKMPPAERSMLVRDLQETVERATTLAPDDPAVMAARSNAWISLVNTGNQSLQNNATPASEAVPFFQGAVAISPDSTGSQFGLGLAYLLDQNAAEAAEPLARAIELEPDYTNASIYLARAYLSMDRGSDAVDVLQAAIDNAAADDPDVDRLNQEYLNALATSGQTERALGVYEAEVANDGSDPVVRYNYGTLLLGMERYEEAIEQFEEAVRLNGESADAHYNLGVANFRQAGLIETQANDLDLNQQEEFDALIAQRDELIEAALESLVTAREMTAEDDRTSICSTLMTIYNSLGRADDAEEAAECAGVTMN